MVKYHEIHPQTEKGMPEMLNNEYKPITALTIAEKVGVARSTVSRVLNNNAKKYRISDKTAKKIFETARSLNYVPNEMARNLRLRRSRVLSMVCGNLAHNWAQAILNGIDKVVHKQTYNTFLARHGWDIDLERKEFESIIARRDEGVICQPIPYSTNYDMLLERRIPLVFTSDCLESMPDASFVAWESGPAARVAVEHLVQIGRKRIGFIGVKHPTISTRSRFNAFGEVIKESGLELNEKWIARDHLAADLVYQGDSIIGDITERMFESGSSTPDALFVLNDAVAYMVLKKLYKMGIRVPDDVAVIGMGDLPVSDDFAVGLSTVREPLEEMGRQSVEALIELIENPSKSPIQRFVKSTELKIRRTTVS